MSEFGSRPGIDHGFTQSRRDFLKNAARFSGGLVLGGTLVEIELPASNELSRITTEATGKQTGNSQFRDYVTDLCKTSANAEQCGKDFLRSPSTQLESVITAPITEELYLRTIPSFLVSATDNEVRNPFKESAIGTGGFKFSRKELIVGTITTLTFGFLHNITKKGFDTNTIPTPQLLLGAVNWILQRRFGVLAPILNHARWNHKILNG